MINSVVLVGRLTRDPEIRFTKNGIATCNFSLAVERDSRNADGSKTTDFINLVAWRKTAELIGQYLKRGSQTGVCGSLQMRKYQTKEGENRTVYEVLVDRVQFLGEKSGEAENAPAENQGADTPPPPGDDEMPF